MCRLRRLSGFLPFIGCSQSKVSAVIPQVPHFVSTQVQLQQTVGQRHKDHLVDNQRQGPGLEIGQIPKALQLTMTFLNRWPQPVLVSCRSGIFTSFVSTSIQISS